MIEHQINQNASDRDVKPDRHGPAPDPSMAVPAPSKCRDQGKHNQGQGDEREQDMGGEHGKINGSDPPMVTGGFFANMEMISDITNQEKSR